MDTEKLAKRFKALGHPTRIKIVKHLIRINACVCGEIVDIFSHSQSTISQHLKQLKESGIVRSEVKGSKTYFFLNKEVLQQLKAHIDKL